MRKLLFTVCVLTHLTGNSQVFSGEALDLKEIMKGYDFIGHPPENIHWSADGNRIYFNWNPNQNPSAGLFEYNLSNKGGVHDADSTIYAAFDPEQSIHSTSYSIQSGALVACNAKTGEKKIVFQASAGAQEVQRVQNSDKVYFIVDEGLFCYDQRNATITQACQFQNGSKPIEKKDSNFLMKEEVALFDYLKSKKSKNDWNQKHGCGFFPKTPILFKGNRVVEHIQISPYESFISYVLSDYPKEKETAIQHHISSDGHSYTKNARGKVGTDDAEHTLFIYNRHLDSVMEISLSKLTDIRKKPIFLGDSIPYEADRKVSIHHLIFNPIYPTAVCDIRSYDNKDRWLILIDLKTGKINEIEKQHDDAWIGGPGISGWNTEPGTLGWLTDGKTVYFQSEISGYSHLYLLDVTTQKKRALTEGKWEVHQAQLNKKGDAFYLSANRSHPGNRDFLKLDITNRSLSCILCGDGFHEVTMSPDEQSLAVRYSYKNKPWELYTAPNEVNTKLTQITDSRSPRFKAVKWTAPEVITFSASDGVDVYARIYEPKPDKKNGAAVMFVHGAGYLQNAHNYWSNYYREWMFHQLLAEKGYTVLDVDYRASEGYGRDYRTAIYRHMGGRDLADYIDGKNFLVQQKGIDPKRVGIYGGSYGGFITLMAMLTTPDEFLCGAALRSVTDWAHYNHEYTSNILNEPENDPESYRKSSPIYFANGLKGKLLMLHGMVDDNVQFQDVVRLSQRFIELYKSGWDLAVYPVESHGFKEPSSWYDEYRRILELFEENLSK
jgi:dipeptidyl aminopeptidase/acylaminoacyl peptidase